ncbi:MAG: class I SAM-dependent methyltransferase [Firmicutes bacterium]|nr:class I SAM-dependent methyltransferase [Bacillota bacterium]
MKLDDIKKHWEEAGRQFSAGKKITPTSRDPYLACLERENILSYLKKHHTVLEIGCGNGSHTVHYAKEVKKISGIDVAESLITLAKERAASESIRNADFTAGSVLNIKDIYLDRKFSCVISQRCLINLPEWLYQQDAISQIHSLLENDGLLLLTEGFQEELDNLNGVRAKFGLAEIKTVDYNRNMLRKDFEPFIKKYFDIVEIRNYGAYLFFSRVYHPLAVLPEEPKHDSRLNESAMEISRKIQMPDLEKYSYNLFYVLRKK